MGSCSSGARSEVYNLPMLRFSAAAQRDPATPRVRPSAAPFAAALLGLALGIAAVPGCGGSASRPRGAASASGGSDAGGSAGKTGSGGTTTDVATTGTGGASGTADALDGVGGAGGAGGADRPDGDAATAADAPSTDTAETGGEVGGPDVAAVSPITKVVPTAGCGQVAVAGAGTVMTMGTKPPGCADSRCGPWAYPRDYFVYLPQGYVNTKAYPLVIMGPGCMGTAQNIYALNDGTAANAGNSVIRVGIAPPPNTIGHATNPNQGCFDDKEGDDSVDWVFYETLYDKLATQLCFDRNRVFAGGDSSGGWWANEMGCKYAGDDTRPIRGVLTNNAGLPTESRSVPTCTAKPMAGFWVYEFDDTSASFSTGSRVPIARAMKVNECTPGISVDTAEVDDFPIGGGNPATTCKQIRGCPPLYPLVFCRLPRTNFGNHDAVYNPGASTFLKQFSTGAFIAP